MKWLKQQLKQGVFGTGWINAGICVLLVVSVYFTSKIYAILNHGPNVIFMKSPLDDLLPLVKPFVIPYVSLELVIYTTLLIFLFFHTRLFQSAALSMIAAWFISYAFYYFLQSLMIRPTVTGDDPLTQMLIGVYTSDNPYNDFPSLHTSLSTILAIHWWQTDRRIAIPVAIWVALIVASTMLVKQHYIADVVGGLLIAFGASFFFIKQIVARRTLPNR